MDHGLVILDTDAGDKLHMRNKTVTAGEGTTVVENHCDLKVLECLENMRKWSPL